MDQNQRVDQIDAAAQRLAAKRPFLEPILRPCALILKEKARQVAAFSQHRQPLVLEAGIARLDQGVPLLAGVDLQPLKQPLDSSFAAMAAALGAAFPTLDQALQPVLTRHRDNRLDLVVLSAALIEGATSSIDEQAHALGIDPAVLSLALHSGLAPVLEWVTQDALPLGLSVWGEGTCPVCGSLPSVAFLSVAEDLGSEFLVGGGGERFLHCSLCAHQWRIPRTLCPACADNDQTKRIVYQEDEASGERLDVCLNCQGYLPCLDLRQAGESIPPMEIAAIGMAHLDAWAVGKGYHPLAQTLWNQV